MNKRNENLKSSYFSGVRSWRIQKFQITETQNIILKHVLNEINITDIIYLIHTYG